MASHLGDDSSVEDNTSSIGDSTWDIVDDGSGISDDEDHPLSRQHTPSTDGLEHEVGSGGSLEENATSDESQGMGSMHGHDTFAKPQTDSHSVSHEPRSVPSIGHPAQFEEDMEETEKSLRRMSAKQQPTQPFRFQEPEYIRGQSSEVVSSEVVEVRHVLKTFEEEHLARVSRDFDLHQVRETLVGTVRMKMSRGGLQLKRPYKILLVAPPSSAKETVMQKIGSALASSLESASPGSNDGLARFTVVPISSFGDGGSPEVLLVNSLGIDMSVDECISACIVKEESWNDTIALELLSRKSVQSFWDHTANTFKISVNYKLPDVAVICFSENEETSAKHTRLLTRSFMIRHGIPVIMISLESEWNKPAQSMTLDLRTPHFCLELPGSKEQDQQVLKRLPIDLLTFLDIDSSQMGRNLACIASNTDADPAGKIESHASTQSTITVINAIKGWSKRLDYTLPQDLARKLRTTAASTPWMHFLIHFLTLLLCLSGLVITSIYTYRITSPLLLQSKDVASTSVASGVTSLTRSVASVSSYTSTQSPAPSSLESSLSSEEAFAKSISPVQTNADLASFLFELPNALPTYKSDKFKLHVIGDCHVVLRPPQWFTSLRRAPVLHFNITRKEENLKYEFSTIFDGVHALKLAREDAYGVLDISVWTMKKPIINETFQVDFGTPWLKLAGWKKAAQALTEQVLEELQSAQSGLNVVYGQTSTGVQALMRNAVKKAESVLKEVEKIGMSSLNQTSHTTELMIAQSKELSRTVAQKLHRHKNKASRFATRRREMRQEVYNYTRRMSSLFTHQAQLLTEAATGLNIVALAQEVQQYREKNLRHAQKKVLKMWWKVRGVPSAKKSKTPRKERPRTRHHRSKAGSNR